MTEDLLLLLTDDTTGKHVVGNPGLDLVLAGANLLELAELGKVDVSGAQDTVKKGRIIVRDQTPTGERLLDDALRVCIERQGKKPAAVLDKMTKKLRKQVLAGLVERGVLRVESGKLLRIFPVTRWPAVNAQHERVVRERVTSALVRGSTPDPRTAALIALLSSVDASHKVLDPSLGADKKAVRRRAKDIGHGTWATEAVGAAIEAVQAAVTGAIVGAVVVSSAGSSGG